MSSGKRKIPRLALVKPAPTQRPATPSAGSPTPPTGSSSSLPSGSPTLPSMTPTTSVTPRSRTAFAPCSLSSGLTHLPRALSGKRPSITSSISPSPSTGEGLEQHGAATDGPLSGIDHAADTSEPSKKKLPQDYRNHNFEDDAEGTFNHDPKMKTKKDSILEASASSSSSIRKDAPPIYNRVRGNKSLALEIAKDPQARERSTSTLSQR